MGSNSQLIADLGARQLQPCVSICTHLQYIMEEKSPTNTVMTFYNDLADEVDQHFARALQSTTTSVNQGRKREYEQDIMCFQDTTLSHDSGKAVKQTSQFYTAKYLISNNCYSALR